MIDEEIRRQRRIILLKSRSDSLREKPPRGGIHSSRKVENLAEAERREERRGGRFGNNSETLERKRENERERDSPCGTTRYAACCSEGGGGGGGVSRHLVVRQCV